MSQIVFHEDRSSQLHFPVVGRREGHLALRPAAAARHDVPHVERLRPNPALQQPAALLDQANDNVGGAHD